MDYQNKSAYEGDIHHLSLWHKAALSVFNFAGRSVLDVGCGSGSFLFAIKEKAKYCLGIDPNKNNTQFLLQKSIPALTGFLENLSDQIKQSIDVITCFEVIEHIYNHKEILRPAYGLLEPGGVFMVSTPNAFNVFRTLYFVLRQEHRDSLLDPTRSQEPEHLRLWSYPMLERALKNEGFVNVKGYGVANIFNRIVVLRAPILVKYLSQNLLFMGEKP